MGLLDILFGGVKDMNAKYEIYYQEGMEMPEEYLRERYKRAFANKDTSRAAGYARAMEERGIDRD